MACVPQMTSSPKIDKWQWMLCVKNRTTEAKREAVLEESEVAGLSFHIE
jgi:hypothetical protein